MLVMLDADDDERLRLGGKVDPGQDVSVTRKVMEGKRRSHVGWWGDGGKGQHR